MKSNLLDHMLPQVPREITPGMRRYLVSKLLWVNSYVAKTPNSLLLPEHYIKLLSILNGMNTVANPDGTCPSLSSSLLTRLIEGVILEKIPSFYCICDKIQTLLWAFSRSQFCLKEMLVRIGENIVSQKNRFANQS